MNDWAIVLFATCGLSDFVKNALKGIVVCGIDPGLVQVVIPDNAQGELRDLIEKPGAKAVILESLIAGQTEAVAQFPPVFCVGFYAVRSSPEAFDLIDRLIAAYSRDPIGLHDQELFNQIVRVDPRALKTIFPLPEALFTNGLLHAHISAAPNDGVVMFGRVEPFIFHANWTIGLENKRRLLMHAGAWLVRNE
jgi:hypothetical protein